MATTTTPSHDANRDGQHHGRQPPPVATRGGWGPERHGDPGDLPPVAGGWPVDWGGRHPPRSASGRATRAPIGIRAGDTRPDRQTPQLPRLMKVGA